MHRDEFLSRVETAIATSVLPDLPAVPEELPSVETDDLVDVFRASLLAVNGVFHGPMSRNGAPRSIAGIAAGHGCESFVAWDDLPVSGVASALTSAGLDRVGHDVPQEGRLEHQLDYLDLDLGITGSIAGLAESGSVVLSHGPGRPRMASLIPEVHVALVEVRSLYWTLSHWAQGYPEAVNETANLVLVTGPSRTGDIEQTLNLGVHGPRHLHVVMVR